jgi:hypothetical protein
MWCVDTTSALSWGGCWSTRQPAYHVYAPRLARFLPAFRTDVEQWMCFLHDRFRMRSTVLWTSRRLRCRDKANNRVHKVNLARSISSAAQTRRRACRFGLRARWLQGLRGPLRLHEHEVRPTCQISDAAREPFAHAIVTSAGKESDLNWITAWQLRCGERRASAASAVAVNPRQCAWRKGTLKAYKSPRHRLLPPTEAGISTRWSTPTTAAKV